MANEIIYTIIFGTIAAALAVASMIQNHLQRRAKGALSNPSSFHEATLG